MVEVLDVEPTAVVEVLPAVVDVDVDVGVVPSRSTSVGAAVVVVLPSLPVSVRDVVEVVVAGRRGAVGGGGAVAGAMTGAAGTTTGESCGAGRTWRYRTNVVIQPTRSSAVERRILTSGPPSGLLAGGAVPP